MKRLYDRRQKGITMPDQVQCSNCGGYKTELRKVENISEKVSVTPEERKKNTTDWLKALPLYAVLAIVLFFFGPQTGHVSTCFGVLVIAIPIFVIPYVMKRKTKEVRAGEIHTYYCRLCGYEWKLGTPDQRVNIRPDLIALGEQQLEKETRQAEIGHHIAQDILNRKH